MAPGRDRDRDDWVGRRGRRRRQGDGCVQVALALPLAGGAGDIIFRHRWRDPLGVGKGSAGPDTASARESDGRWLETGNAQTNVCGSTAEFQRTRPTIVLPCPVHIPFIFL